MIFQPEASFTACLILPDLRRPQTASATPYPAVVVTSIRVFEIYGDLYGMGTRDKRKHPRVSTSNLISFELYNDDGDLLNQSMARALNISQSGILIETAHKIAAERISLMSAGADVELVKIMRRAMIGESRLVAAIASAGRRALRRPGSGRQVVQPLIEAGDRLVQLTGKARWRGGSQRSAPLRHLVDLAGDAVEALMDLRKAFRGVRSTGGRRRCRRGRMGRRGRRNPAVEPVAE